ncbi:PucR family transcriptional regulator [Anoxynatronum buryatiense]|nr:helix-turn-helix domain-containing protein [Anoxynatronum buryatiense]
MEVLKTPVFSEEFKQIQVLTDASRQCEAHTLYFCKDMKQIQLVNSPIMIFVTKTPSSVPDSAFMVIIKEKDFANILSLSRHYLMEDLKAESDLYQFAEAALNGESIPKLINTAAGILGNALILSDANLNIIAHATNFEIMDPLWAENLERRYCTDEFKKKVLENEQMANWSKKDDDAIIIQLEGDPQPKLVSRVVENGRLVGGITMIEHHTPLQHFHFKLLHRVGVILFKKLEDNLYKGGQNSLPSTILYNLLDSSEFGDGAPLPTFDFPQTMQAIVARFLHPISNRHIKRTVTMELEQIFPKGYSIQYKGYIGIVVESISDSQKQKLRNLSHYREVSFGISWPFHHIGDFKRHFNQCIQAIKYAEVLETPDRILEYTDFAYYHLLHSYSGNLSLDHFCHPVLNTLKAYDRVNNSDLYHTLYTYLLCDKNLRQTAANLFIHKNSLTYRLNRIKELTGLDFNHSATIFALIDSFRIQIYLDSIFSNSSP